MRFTLAAIGLVAATLTFAAPAAAAPSPVPSEAAPAPVPSARQRAATPAPVPDRGSRPVPDGAPQTGGGVPAALPLGGVLLVAGAATGFVALRRRSAA
ncbi:LPXTG cell wall anchor domain-containing protein [Herbidospora cretacea]|uniref:LPXTG cell wall anchor domain-containing protein n=1 Tax=Herbidospora cretacea TaxID=28444 RepID=UPI00069139E8|nr:LPXTG cell wall anchor domain-containing protein [Herbidospora cretacea]